MERLRVGTTALSNAEIARICKIAPCFDGRELQLIVIVATKYALYYRPYSPVGDNCQQFILQFCREISVEFDEEASKQLQTATGIANLLRSSISFLCVLFLLDIFVNKGRFCLATSVHSLLALFGMALLTFCHPRMFLLKVSHLPFNISHFITLLFSSLVYLLWIIVGIVLAFSFERSCDDIAVRMVDGVEVFDVWNWCNILLRVAQFLIGTVCLLGCAYHTYYTTYFVLDC